MNFDFFAENVGAFEGCWKDVAFSLTMLIEMKIEINIRRIHTVTVTRNGTDLSFDESFYIFVIQSLYLYYIRILSLA